jgi:hypothetical protein
MTEIDRIWPKMTEKLPKMAEKWAENRPKLANMGQNGPKWAKMGQN